MLHNHVNGRNIEVTDAIKAYAKEKVGRVAGHYDQILSIDTVLSVIKNPSVADSHVAEVTCKVAGETIHVAERSETIYAAIDLVADKLERQVKKHKEKNLKSKSKSESIRTASVIEEEAEAGEETEA